MEKITIEKTDLQAVYDFAWGKDVPHSTCPEYKELHVLAQGVMKLIDDILCKEV